MKLAYCDWTTTYKNVFDSENAESILINCENRVLEFDTAKFRFNSFSSKAQANLNQTDSRNCTNIGKFVYDKSKTFHYSFLPVKSDQNINDFRGLYLSKGLGLEYGYPLKEDIEFQLSNYVFRVQHICIKPAGIHLKKTNKAMCKPTKFDSINSNHLEEEFESFCRICLSANTSKSNPLLNICKCTGSIAYIHYNCLKEQTRHKSQISFSSPDITLKLYDKLICEICKCSLPMDFIYNNKRYSLNSEEISSQRSYIVLEYTYYNKIESNQSKSFIYTVFFDDSDCVTLGSSPLCTLVFKDNTISRTHSKIRIVNKTAFLSDCNSELGTCIRLPDELPIGLYSKLFIKQNNYVIALESKLNSSALFNCFKRLKYSRFNYSKYFQDLMFSSPLKIFIKEKENGLSSDEISSDPSTLKPSRKQTDKGSKTKHVAHFPIRKQLSHSEFTIGNESRIGLISFQSLFNISKARRSHEYSRSKVLRFEDAN